MTNAVLPSLDNFVLGQIRRFQTAINPKGFPGGTYVTPVELPSFTSFNRYNEFALYVNDNWSLRNRLTLNLGVRYEYFGPQKKSEPNTTRTSITATRTSRQHELSRPRSCAASRPARRSRPTRARSARCGSLTRTTWRPAWLRLGRHRRRPDERARRLWHGLRAQLRQCDLQRAVQSAAVPGRHHRCRLWTFRACRSSRDPAGPFGGVAGVTKTIPAASLRHVDQNIETAYAHFYSGVVPARARPGLSGSVEYTGSSGRKLYDLPIRTSAARHWSTWRRADRTCGRTPVTRRSTPAATVDSRSITASPSASMRAVRPDRAAVDRASTRWARAKTI